jgi:hypothetical protein
MIGGRIAALLIAVAVAGCGASPPPDPTQVQADDAILWFRAVSVATDSAVSAARAPVITDAALWVDGRYVGTLEALRGGVAVEPGRHRVEIRHDDYLSYYAELTLSDGQRQRLTVELAPILR